MLIDRVGGYIISYLPAGSLRARMAKGTFWTIFGSVIAQGAGVLASILCARILGKVGFGELGMVRSTVLMFGVLAGTGLGLAATKYVAEYRIKDPLKAGRMIGLLFNSAFILGGSVTLICLISAAPLARLAMNAPHLTDTLQVGCVLLLLNTLNGVQLGVVCGFEAFRTQSQVIIMDGIFSLVFVPTGAYFYGVNGAVGGLVVAVLFGFVVKQWALRKVCKHANIKIFHRNVSAELPALWKFVLPAVLVGVSIQPFEWLTRLMLVRQPNGYAELGVFTAVLSWAQLILFLPGKIAGPLMPILSNSLATGHAAQLRKVVFSSQMLVFALAVITAVPLAWLSPFILRAYGPDFDSGQYTLLTMIVAYVVSAATMISRSFFAASDLMWLQTIHTSIWGGVLALGCIFLIHYGSLGLALSYLCAYFIFIAIQLATQTVVLNKIIKEKSSGL